MYRQPLPCAKSIISEDRVHGEIESFLWTINPEKIVQVVRGLAAKWLACTQSAERFRDIQVFLGSSLENFSAAAERH